MPAGLELIAEAEAVVARQHEASALAALRKWLQLVARTRQRLTQLWKTTISGATGRTQGALADMEVTNCWSAIELQQGRG